MNHSASISVSGHSEIQDQAKSSLGVTIKEHSYRHPEPCEGSKSTTANGHHAGSFTSFRMTNKGVHQQRSEESSSMLAGGYRSGFFAALRMTVWGAMFLAFGLLAPS
ncbi:MAG TPA: hypothetical protein VIM71_15125, partial [Lacunisphaera sp.]